MTTEGITFIIFCMTLFALLFGNRYLSSKERMYRIEKGIDVEPPKKEVFLTTLKIALVLIGIGFGILTGFLLTTYVYVKLRNPEVIYFGAIGLLTGIGLLIAFFFERSYFKNRDNV